MFDNDNLIYLADESNLESDLLQRTKKLRAIACEMDNYERFDVLDD